MHTYFGISDVTAEVAYSLDHLRMNPDDQIVIYNVAFLWYSAQLQWTESALCYRYYSGLSDRIQDIISTHKGGKSFTFQTLYSTAVSINNHFWEQKRKSERALYSAPQCSLYSECFNSVSYLAISDPSVTPQVNFPWKITFDTLYTNEFVIRVRSRVFSISSERNTIWWGHWASSNQTRAHVETSGGKQDELASGLWRKS